MDAEQKLCWKCKKPVYDKIRWKWYCPVKKRYDLKEVVECKEFEVNLNLKGYRR